MLRLGGFLAAALLTVALAAPVLACNFDHAPTSRWSLANENGVEWLKTPCGERFYSLGVNILDGGNGEHAKLGDAYTGYDWEKFAPTLADWARETRHRLAEWGFNSAGGWSLPPQQLRLPTVIDLELGRRAKFHWFDPFSPDTEARMMTLAKELVAPYRGSPYRIGYFSDNEVGWWAGALFGFFSMKPADNLTKQRWVAMLRQHYGNDWALFTADFRPPDGVGSWDELLAARQLTSLRPNSRGIDAVREWCGLVAERYYTLAERAIHAADPDALYFGDRLPIYYDPAAVKAMAPHVDAIAVNYNVDAGDGWLARYFFDGLEKLSGGKPVLVTEWFFAARENRTGNTNNGHLMTVGTQAERAQGAAAATRNFAALPEIVGTQWFQYYDHPKGGRSDGEDYNFGLVDIQDRPYERLVEALAAANRDAPTIHAAALEPSGRDAPVVLPHADIDIDAKSLTDWPKPASLLPPMKPSPGAVDFGEVYLSWSERGLALGTIGQDYFDISLFPYSGGFPLGDAYRLELGVDFGAGPRRFTLFFIPPRTKLHDYPEMQARLCAGSAQQAIASGCTPVKNAETVYFGADQPRITAEMLLPWSALGISLPQPGAKLRAEVTMTSWHGERWMSLSGAAPDQAMTDAARWMPMRLGDGLAVKRSTGAPG
ncbi:MAG: hypothetical protein JO204_03265 [Alphaproteobacteria bacterium]|nr:hypothetical protein [Alphaproteobacteria bacterium]